MLIVNSKIFSIIRKLLSEQNIELKFKCFRGNTLIKRSNLAQLEDNIMMRKKITDCINCDMEAETKMRDILGINIYTVQYQGA